MDDLYGPNYGQLIKDARFFNHDMDGAIEEIPRSFENSYDALEYLAYVTAVGSVLLHSGGRPRLDRLLQAIDEFVLSDELELSLVVLHSY